MRIEKEILVTKRKRTLKPTALVAQANGTFINSVSLTPNSTQVVKIPKDSNRVTLKNAGPGKIEFGIVTPTPAWPLDSGEQTHQIGIASDTEVHVKSVGGPATLLMLFEG